LGWHAADGELQAWESRRNRFPYSGCGQRLRMLRCAVDAGICTACWRYLEARTSSRVERRGGNIISASSLAGDRKQRDLLHWRTERRRGAELRHSGIDAERVQVGARSPQSPSPWSSAEECRLRPRNFIPPTKAWCLPRGGCSRRKSIVLRWADALSRCARFAQVLTSIYAG
jgi:hypothetical protein